MNCTKQSKRSVPARVLRCILWLQRSQPSKELWPLVPNLMSASCGRRYLCRRCLTALPHFCADTLNGFVGSVSHKPFPPFPFLLAFWCPLAFSFLFLCNFSWQDDTPERSLRAALAKFADLAHKVKVSVRRECENVRTCVSEPSSCTPCQCAVLLASAFPPCHRSGVQLITLSSLCAAVEEARVRHVFASIAGAHYENAWGAHPRNAGELHG